MIKRPVVPILALAGLFDILSGDPLVHGGVLFAAAGALVADGLRHPVDSKTRRHPRLAQLHLSPVAVAASLVFVAVVGAFGRYSWPATVAVAAPASVGVLLAWAGPLRERPDAAPLDRKGTLPWLTVLVGVALWELTTFLLQPSLTASSWAHPTISTLMDPVLASRARRSVFLGMWLGSGWYVVTR